jgi:hypothetical protein
MSSNSLIGEVVFELLPPFFLLAPVLEDFVDLEARAADFDFVARIFGRTNSLSLFKRVVSFGLAVWIEEVEVSS